MADPFFDIATISENMLLQIEEINTLRDSLQREFEWFASTGEIFTEGSPGSKKLLAKKRQQEILNSIKAVITRNHDLLDKVSGYIWKVEACCLVHGLDPYEIEYFTNKGKERIQQDLKDLINLKMVQAPGAFIPFIDFEKAAAAIVKNLEPRIHKFSDRPVLDWSGLNKQKQV